MTFKKLSAAFMSAVLAVTMCGCNNNSASSDNGADRSSVVEPAESTDNTASTSEPEQSTPEAKAGFTVSGTKLLDANGNEFVMRGVNHAHTWFQGQLDTALNAIAETGANSVRVVLADGDQWNKTTPEEVEQIIAKCIELKMIAILEVHDATGKEEQSYLNNAADFWIELKDILNAHTDTVIVNIANEWIGQWQSANWKAGYIKAIPKLREAGIKNTLMVDAAGWGQFGASIKQSGKSVFESDPDSNTMFSIHMYGSAGKNEKTITDNLKGATDQGLCVVVGEFGYNHSDGDVDEAFIMQYCNENALGYLGWSWKGNGGGVEYLDIAKEWDGSVLSEDWGENLINGENGIKQTAKICSVFEN